MWMWVEAADGRRLWKVVLKGESRREDNRRLTVGSDSKKGTKKPVWVTDTWYKKMKDVAKGKGKGKAMGKHSLRSCVLTTAHASLRRAGP